MDIATKQTLLEITVYIWAIYSIIYYLNLGKLLKTKRRETIEISQDKSSMYDELQEIKRELQKLKAKEDI